MAVQFANPTNFRHLRPSNKKGARYLLLVCLLSGLGGLASVSGIQLVSSVHSPLGFTNWLSFGLGIFLWCGAQLLFALVFFQWFVLLHEAGHYSLFADRRLNTITGHLSGFFSLIPFHAWRYIHSRHHRWTGWQDLDSTTASLVPRPLKKWERFLLRFLWQSHLPFVSILYRLSNYWYLPRMRQYLTEGQLRRALVNIGQQLFVYIGILFAFGIQSLLLLFGPGLFLSFVAQDLILLSQHTHLPQRLCKGKAVQPFLPEEQGEFTRSLRFPRWFSRLILHFDAHELHHEFVHVPGYELGNVHKNTPHEVSWWTWIRESKRIPGDVFLFANRDETGFPW